MDATVDAPADRRWYAVAPDPAPTTSTNRYLERRELGRGGMGVVVEALDTQLGRRVALKRLREPKDPVLRMRFETEALITAQLDHPDLPTLYEYDPGSADRPPACTMRLVEGSTLAQRLRASRTLEERLELLPALLRVAHALAHAHDRGVIHRDVKPDNILVGPHGEAVLLDWGVAKVRDVEATDEPFGPDRSIDAASTRHGDILGTPAYMAPEQARGDVAAMDARSDVFGLGAILFHMLAGRPPMLGPTTTSSLRLAANGDIPRIDRVAPRAPEALRGIVRQALDPDPERRHADAAAFASALESVMTRAVTGGDARAERWISLSTGLLIALASGLFILAWTGTPTLHAMGWASTGTVGFGALGLTVAAFEGATRGRHRLLGLGVATAAMTLLAALAGGIVGMLRVNEGLARPEIAGNEMLFRTLAANGYVEAMGNIPFGCAMTILQALALAVAWRRRSSSG